MIPLCITEDGLGRTYFMGTRQPSFIDCVWLPPDVGVTVVVPTGAKHVLFSLSADFFVKYTTDAITSAAYAHSVSTSGVCAGTAGELNPWLRTLTGISGFAMIAPDGATVTLSWFG